MGLEEHHILTAFVAVITTLGFYILLKIYIETHWAEHEDRPGWRTEGCLGPGGDGLEMSCRVFPGK